MAFECCRRRGRNRPDARANVVSLLFPLMRLPYKTKHPTRCWTSARSKLSCTNQSAWLGRSQARPVNDRHSAELLVAKLSCSIHERPAAYHAPAPFSASRMSSLLSLVVLKGIMRTSYILSLKLAVQHRSWTTGLTPFIPFLQRRVSQLYSPTAAITSDYSFPRQPAS